MLQKLIDILEYEAAQYKELLFLLQEEKRLLFRRVRDELFKLAAGIETIAMRVAEAEKARKGIVSDIAALNGIDSERVRLSMIIDIADEPYRGKLTEIQSVMRSLAESIKELNRENSVVINRSLENISTALTFLRDASRLETYQPSGAMTTKTGLSIHRSI